MAKKSAPAEVCGAVVRLFKYLISDYYSDFLSNLHAICSRVAFAPQSAERQQQRQKWQNLRLLYGSSVLPDEMLALLNGDVADLTHCPESAAQAPGASAASEERLAAVRQQLVEVLRRILERL